MNKKVRKPWLLSISPGTSETRRHLPPFHYQRNTKGEAQEQLLMLAATGLLAFLGCSPLGVSLFPTSFLVMLLLLLLWQSGYIPFSVSLLSHYPRKVKKEEGFGL